MVLNKPWLSPAFSARVGRGASLCLQLAALRRRSECVRAAIETEGNKIDRLLPDICTDIMTKRIDRLS